MRIILRWAMMMCIFAGLGASAPISAVAQGPAVIGSTQDGGELVATDQLIHPAGQSVQFHGRPVDLVLSPDGTRLYVKDNRGLVVIDTGAWKILDEAKFSEGGSSMHGLAVTQDGSRIFASGAKNLLWEAAVGADGDIQFTRKISLPGPKGPSDKDACICGIALSSNDKTAYVCLSRNNSLGVVDLDSGTLVKEIPVGIAPFGVAVSLDGQTAYVSNRGGRHPNEGERTSKSSGTDVAVDSRGICSSGTVSVVDLTKDVETMEIETGLLPSDLRLSADGRILYVANANSDTVSIIDTSTNKVAETVLVRPDPALPFGSSPNALAVSADGQTLFVANGGNDALAVVALGTAANGGTTVKGFVPTGWYPGAVATDGSNIYVANVKGLGSRWKSPRAKGWDIFDYLGTVNKIVIPSDAALREYTAQVTADGNVPQVLQAFEKAATGQTPVPVPERTGEPSVFEHVVYIIKENKTYDQVFGDMSRGNSDPDLCVYGREVSPNHHALADQFVLLDNYYCNGVLSADGHQWVTEGDATDYLEKSFGGWTRSYPAGGDDAIAYAPSGMIWDDALANGLSFRNYGEQGSSFTFPIAPWKSVYKDYVEKTHKFFYLLHVPNENLGRYSCPKYPSWDLHIPDVARADIFLRELRDYEKKGNWPNLMTVYLPNDHTSGGSPGMPTPRAQVADNDLALGRVIEGISKSKFWPKTCIFVEEDDPQSGFDHVDGHRSLCLVVSPYTKRGALISEFYNQTSVLHTMERILGIPPMNQMDAMAPVMSECFTDVPDFRPYLCVPNNIPLNEISTGKRAYYGKREHLTEKDLQAVFSLPDQINDDELNRVIWSLAKGADVPYPARFAGAHETGLGALHLKLDDEDD